jgi:hypothetical protein
MNMQIKAIRHLVATTLPGAANEIIAKASIENASTRAPHIRIVLRPKRRIVKMADRPPAIEQALPMMAIANAFVYPERAKK